MANDASHHSYVPFQHTIFICIQLIGLLYLIGLEQRRHLGVEDLFSTKPGIGSVYAATVFSKHRFKQLLSALRFDDKTNRDPDDPLAAIRLFFDQFTENCRTCYVPGSFITIDESMADFCGRCKFKMYLPSKTVISFTLNLRNSARTFTMDNFFTSIPLAEKLLQDRTYCVATVRPNRRFIPHEFVEQKYSLNQMGFIFHKHLSLAKFQSKTEKAVYLLSMKHPSTLVGTCGEGMY
uniref:PiggyBac transposable element-derived protein domain-containing protein n=1 Tax=Romanomermis culicivorax TaxID=13658 RepID=A0A915HV48_ROMCU